MKQSAAQRIRHLLQGMLLLAVLLLQLPNLAAADSIYGRGGYGSCPYGHACAVTPPTTIVLPSGLDVSVNLTDGQTISSGSYTIRATPLNGQGSSFDHIDFYIDGELITTIRPDTTGTATWAWDTTEHPGANVTIVVTGTDGQTVTKAFHVHIAPAQAAEPVASGQRAQEQSEGLLDKVARWIAALPVPFVRTFPYILFLILLINLILLGLQLRKELHEYALAKRLLARQRDITDMKKIFLQLSSHYLRTPLTVIGGGIDMLADEAQAAWIGLKRSLSENIELLITQTRTEVTPVDDLPAAQQRTGGLHFWQRPGLFVPVVLVGIVVAVFDYLANRAAKFNITQTNIAVQVLSFFTLTILTYLVFRRLRLHRQDVQELERIRAAETALSQARDDLLAEAVGLLQRSVRQIGDKAVALPADQPKKFITRGYEQLTGLLQKIQLAVTVRSEHATKPFASLSFGQLLRQASTGVVEAAAQRHIKLPVGADQAVWTRDQGLLVMVIASLLDNAVVYSEDGASIEAGYRTGKATTTLTITDHGKGIPSDRLSALFAPFQKLEGAETFDHEGMGFSLFLDRLIMAYLGGSIDITSPQGDGTQVTLVLPNAEASQA